MKWLTFAGNKIQIVPDELFELDQLCILDLKMNQFQTFPFDKVVKSLPNLKILELYGNENLYPLPKKIEGLPKCYVN